MSNGPTTTPGATPGAPAPDFSPVAAGSRREVDTSSSAGRSIVPILHSQNATFVGRPAEPWPPRETPTPKDPTILGVFDLSLAFPPFRLNFRVAFSSSYRQTAVSLLPIRPTGLRR